MTSTFGLGRLGAGRAAIVATVEPVVAGALGAALLGEELTVPKVVGGMLVISGAALAQARFRRNGFRVEATVPGRPR